MLKSNCVFAWHRKCALRRFLFEMDSLLTLLSCGSALANKRDGPFSARYKALSHFEGNTSGLAVRKTCTRTHKPVYTACT